MHKSIVSYSTLFSIAAGLAVWTSATAASAAPCVVPENDDPVLAGIALEDCIDEVNLALPFSPVSIQFEGPQLYMIKRTLELKRDVVIDGEDQVLQPLPGFEGDALIKVGVPCPGPDCVGPVQATLNGLAMRAGGQYDIRGIEVLGTHTLIADGVTISDFTTTAQGACVYVGQEAEAQFDDSRLENCVSLAEGGAIFSEAALTTIRDSTLQNNEATDGGAIFIGNSGVFDRKLRVWDSMFDSNEAIDGGAVMASGDQIEASLTDSTLSFNQASDEGGGVYGGFELTRCLFDGNIATDVGGGAYLSGPSAVAGSTFDSNEAWRGGGIAVLADGNFDMFIEHSTIANNLYAGTRRFPWGAGIYVGQGVSPVTTGVTYIRNSTITDNVVDPSIFSGHGGGLGVSRVKAVVEHTTLFGNEANSGGGIYMSSASSTDLTLDSSIIAGSAGAGDACSIPGAAMYQTSTSLDDDGSCSVAISSTDPQLGPLMDNGGPTHTHLPAAPEVLGAAACYSSLDQRYQPRPATGCDIGSVQQ